MNSRIIFLLMLSINLLAALIFKFNSEAITYQNQEHFNWWFSFSTHFSHHSMNHLLTNMFGLIILLWLFPIPLRNYLSALIFTMIGVRYYVAIAEIHTFLGFSALLFVLPGHYLIQLIKNKDYIEAISIILIMLLHLEVFYETDIIEVNNWETMHIAHLIGFFTGLLVAYLSSNKSKINNQLKPL